MNEQGTAEVAACTSPGLLRGKNEDAFLYRMESGIFALADGMGGAAGGEVASRTAVEAAIESLAASATDPDTAARLASAVSKANRIVFNRARLDAQLQGMGTTLVLLVRSPGTACIAHVGDSRCYLLREGLLRRCTQDHSLVGEQVRLGHITSEQAEASPYRNIITRAIGTQPSVAPEITEVATLPGDLFLLCSDGLTREISDDEIAACLQNPDSLDEGCRRLIEAANSAGGSDNITCLLVRIS